MPPQGREKAISIDGLSSARATALRCDNVIQSMRPAIIREVSLNGVFLSLVSFSYLPLRTKLKSHYSTLPCVSCHAILHSTTVCLFLTPTPTCVSISGYVWSISQSPIEYLQLGCWSHSLLSPQSRIECVCVCDVTHKTVNNSRDDGSSAWLQNLAHSQEWISVFLLLRFCLKCILLAIIDLKLCTYSKFFIGCWILCCFARMLTQLMN